MPKACHGCPCREKCGASEKGQKVLQRHVWQEFLDVVEAIRKTDLGKALYSMRKETIERVFADAKEKHAMRYTVSDMELENSFSFHFCSLLCQNLRFVLRFGRGSLTN